MGSFKRPSITNLPFRKLEEFVGEYVRNNPKTSVRMYSKLGSVARNAYNSGVSSDRRLDVLREELPIYTKCYRDCCDVLLQKGTIGKHATNMP